jgi:4-hydroxymandelate oxidase
MFNTTGPVLAALTALRIAVGWHFFYEGLSKLLATNWSAAGYLSTAEGPLGPLFQSIGNTPWMVATVDIVNAWALTIIGLCLLLGALTRISSIAGSLLLLLYTLAHPALPGMTGSALGGSYLLIDRNLVEVVTLIMIATLPTGLLWGIDRLRRRRAAPAGATDADAAVPSAGRRELMKDLTGVPVLGAMAAAVIGSRVAADKTASVDALSGATSLLSPPPSGKKGNIVSVRDLERLAPHHMTPANFAYVSGGAGDEQTLRWNEAAFRQIRLRLRVIESQVQPDTRIHLLGHELPHPIMLAPARQADLHPDGEAATVRGAGESGAVAIISSMAKQSIEDIAAAASQPVWYQAYLFKDRDRARDNIQRAEASGYQAICLTMDSASNGPRDRQYRHGRLREPDTYQKYRQNPFTWPTTWDDFEWYRSLSSLPLIPKGIMTPEDAQRSLDLGAAAIYISNHGGRVFDAGIAPIQVLPAIAEQVAGRVPIILDGGIRRGTDILKALALGATAIAIGRPYLYGLAVDGADGVAAAVNMLRNELEMAMVSTRQTAIATLENEAVLSPPPTSTFFSA